jgi:hypothetical protein
VKCLSAAVAAAVAAADGSLTFASIASSGGVLPNFCWQDLPLEIGSVI